MVLILTQSYTANLTSMLTVQRLQPMCVDAKEIIKKGYYVGYLKESFVKELLIDQLGFNESNLKAYETLEEYHEALSRGTYNDGVAAIFNEIPYIKLYLAKYCSRYTMVGPIYKIGGFGFVSLSLSLSGSPPKNTPLLSFQVYECNKNAIRPTSNNFFSNGLYWCIILSFFFLNNIILYHVSSGLSKRISFGLLHFEGNLECHSR